MHKILWSIVALLSVATLNAATFNEPIQIIAHGKVIKSYTENVYVTQSSSTSPYVLRLYDVIYPTGTDSEMTLGNVTIELKSDVQPNQTVLYAENQGATIEDGDPEKAFFWYGPFMYTSATGSVIGKMTEKNLNVSFTLHLTESESVQFIIGDGFQAKNAGFENFNNVAVGGLNAKEPDYWHSYMSGTGGMISLVNDYRYTAISNEKRPGSAGSKSVVITSRGMVDLFGETVFPGMMTTGRLNVDNSLEVESAENYSFIRSTSADKDASGKPYYMPFKGIPDSLVVWVKFKQGPGSSSNNYASLNVGIIDDGFYRIPESSEYVNVVAKASVNAIQPQGGAWQRLSLPLVYTANANDRTPKYLLATFAVNARPFMATDEDSLWVDDLSFVYNAGVEQISVNGQPVEAFSEDVAEYSLDVDGTVEADDISVVAKGRGCLVFRQVDGATATVVVASGDLQTTKTYTFKLVPTGIKEVGQAANDDIKYIYDMNGRLIDHIQAPGFYIIKDSQGNSRKIIVK